MVGMTDRKPPTDLRRHRAQADRAYLLAFFGLLFVVGGALIWAFYGLGGMAAAFLCMGGGVLTVGVLIGLMRGLDKVADWLEKLNE